MAKQIISQFTLAIEETFNNIAYTALSQTLTRPFIMLHHSTWNKIAGSAQFPQNEGVVSILKKSGILIPVGTDEFQVFETWRGDLARHYNTVQSRVLVTRRCNNRCRYCIIKPHTIDMSSETALRMDHFYFRFIEAKRPLNVKDIILGGEPLLNYRVMHDIVRRRFNFCQKLGIRYAFSITTNGRKLSVKIVSELLKYGLECIHVSIAGPEDVHDHLRRTKDGRKSYWDILHNIAAISHSVPIFIEYQYDATAKDYKRIGEMVADFKANEILIKGIGVTPILPQRHNHLFAGGAGDPKIMLEINDSLHEAGFPIYKEPPCMMCIADKKSYLVFDADGSSIIPCPSLQLGELAYGHVDTGIDYLAESQLLKRRFPDRCKSCDLLPACMGGCRLQALTLHGDFNGVFCNYDSLKMSLERYMHHRAQAELQKLDREGKLPLAV